MVGGSSADYPPGNYFPSRVETVGFMDSNGGDLRLLASSRYVSNGVVDAGVDFDQLCAALMTTPPLDYCNSPTPDNGKRAEQQ
jgi:hypothetical protein